MIHDIEPAKRGNLAFLFADHHPSFLIDTVLEGHSGIALADDANNPRVAQLAYADVLTFGGDADHPAASQFVEQLPVDKGILALPERWRDLVRGVHGERLISIERFSFSGAQLNIAHLTSLKERLPEGFQLKQIDIDLAHQIDADSTLISEDHVRNFVHRKILWAAALGFVYWKENGLSAGHHRMPSAIRGLKYRLIHIQSTGRGVWRRLSVPLCLSIVWNMVSKRAGMQAIHDQ